MLQHLFARPKTRGPRNYRRYRRHGERAWRLTGALLIAATTLAAAAPASAQKSGTPVSTIETAVQPVINLVHLSGTVVSPRSARLSASIGGIVDRLDVDLGDRVAKGDRLVSLDADLARHDVARAAAAIAEAKADLNDAKRRVRVAERLVERGNLPQNELDARRAAQDAAEARVARLEAESRQARERLDRLTIRAPFDGVIARKVTELGEWVSPGDTVLELVATGTLNVDIPVPQTYYPQLKGDTDVTLRFDALPGADYAARRVVLVPVSDPSARSFTLRVAPEDSSIPLTPGMSARAELRLATGEEGIVIPRDAVIRYPDGRTTVWAIEMDGKTANVTERQVQLGRTFENQVHVTSGLTAGEQIVVRGNESLRPGQRVRLVEPDS